MPIRADRGLRMVRLAVLTALGAALMACTPARAQNSTNNRTATDCSGTITTGGTAQVAIPTNTGVGGFQIINIDTSEPLWISITGTATAATAGSFPLAAATVTTFANAGTYYSPIGFSHAISIVATTTGHKFTCTRW